MVGLIEPDARVALHKRTEQLDPGRVGTPSTRQRLCVLQAPVLFIENLLERVVDQAQIGIHPHETSIFFFELFDPFKLVDLHATVLAALAVKRGLADSKLAAQVADLLSLLSFLQVGDYLGFSES